MISEVFNYIGYAILLVNCILLLKGFSIIEKPLKFFLLYSSVMFVIQISARVLVLYRIHNLFLSHFYFLFQFILLSLFYLSILTEPKQRKVVYYLLFFSLSLVGVQYLLDGSLFFKFNLFEIFITSLPLIIYATFHLYNLLNDKKKYYYINLGILMYLFGSTILFLTANLLISLKSKFHFQIIFDINIYLYVVYQLFVAYDLKNCSTNQKENIKL